jgi:tetratricopeptide (TPR) repeat protein
MKTGVAVTLAAISLLLGVGVGFAAKEKGPGIEIMRGKPPKEAGIAALQEAQKLAGTSSWDLIAVGRAYYLSGDKAKGQELIDQVVNAKPKASDWQRIGQLYAEAGDQAKAEDAYQKLLAADPKDESSQAEVGAWYIRIGQRDKGEELLARAFARNPDEVWYYVRAGESYLGAPAGR